MSEKTKNSLSALMKKQMSETSKKNLAKKTAAAAASASKEAGKENKDAKETEKDAAQEEMTEEEKLEEAKKASKNKAGERDQTDMIKKMILENIAKYTLLISILVVLAIGLIKFGPEMMRFLNGVFYKVLMGALGSK